LGGARVALVGAVLACARAPQTHEIAIRDFKFQPDTVRIQEGDSVVWRNYDFTLHTATAANRSWDSGSLAADSSWGRTSLGPGRHPYLCTLHPNMMGLIIAE
jgi:plastocyanin